MLTLERQCNLNDISQTWIYLLLQICSEYLLYQICIYLYIKQIRNKANSNALIFDANTFLPLMSIPLISGVSPFGTTINNGENYLIVSRYIDSSVQLLEIDLNFKVNWMPRLFQFISNLLLILILFNKLN